MMFFRSGKFRLRTFGNPMLRESERILTTTRKILNQILLEAKKIYDGEALDRVDLFIVDKFVVTVSPR